MRVFLLFIFASLCLSLAQTTAQRIATESSPTTSPDTRTSDTKGDTKTNSTAKCVDPQNMQCGECCGPRCKICDTNPADIKLVDKASLEFRLYKIKTKVASWFNRGS